MHHLNVMLDDEAVLPTKAHDEDAGFDLVCKKGKTIKAYSSVVYDTGVHIALAKGFVGYVQGRSGLNMQHSIFCPTGTIDSGYTGSIKVKLYNFSGKDYLVKKGDKIAQLVVQPIAAPCSLHLVYELVETDRGDNGFGSTGR